MGVIGELSHSSHNVELSNETLAFDIFSSKEDKIISPAKSTQV